MVSAIGLRCYLITIHEKGDTSLLDFASDELVSPFPEFLTSFVADNAEVVTDDERERSWYFEERDEDGDGSSKGYVHYGTFGFESNFIDNKTKKKNYRRKVDDIEEIPLFYELWCPENKSYAFVSFQSFQGRSCILMVMTRMKDAFESENPGYLLKYKKLLPNDGTGTLYAGAPVKRLRLIKRDVSSDLTDRYFGNSGPDHVDFEVRMSARRKKSLGSFNDISKSITSKSITKNAAGVVVHDGIEFEEAIAEIKIGNKIRPVGIFGSNRDAGVIDITDTVKRGPDGHPTYASLVRNSDEILVDFEVIISNK